MAHNAVSLTERSVRGVAICAAAALVLFLCIPLVAMFWRLLRQGEGVSPEALAILREAMTLSLVTTAIAMAIVLATGVPLAFFLARRPFPGSRFIDTLVDLPIVLPPAVAGIALLVAFGRNGLIGRWLATMGVTIGFTTAAVILAQVFVAAPFFVRAAKSGFQRVDLDLEEAAADLGASPLRTLRTVTLPMALPSLMAGAVLAWARALGEFGATIMFAGNFPGVTQTMPLAIYARFGAGDLTSALVLSIVLLVASVIVLFGLRLLGIRTGTSVI
ncbi:MAG: molybdate ABC transporter permease subunit [Thermomicrobiales bacterium]|nr:molybdate ABC transporter permease subunit [Thermomicrobiales bacterium]